MYSQVRGEVSDVRKNVATARPLAGYVEITSTSNSHNICLLRLNVYVWNKGKVEPGLNRGETHSVVHRVCARVPVTQPGTGGRADARLSRGSPRTGCAGISTDAGNLEVTDGGGRRVEVSAMRRPVPRRDLLRRAAVPSTDTRVPASQHPARRARARHRPSTVVIVFLQHPL